MCVSLLLGTTAIAGASNLLRLALAPQGQRAGLRQYREPSRHSV